MAKGTIFDALRMMLSAPKTPPKIELGVCRHWSVCQKDATTVLVIEDGYENRKQWPLCEQHAKQES